MRLGILGKKVGMTQIFDERGYRIPVTVIDTSDCVISQVKTPEKEGYSALQLALGTRKPQNVDKATAGHFRKANSPARAHVKELRLEKGADLTQVKAGKTLSSEMFKAGDIVDIVGTSKGRGFTGVMKRFGFSGKHATHGTSKYFRHGGSNGSNTFPGRVIKNKGMPGHMGDVKTTAINLEVIKVMSEKGLILVKGAVPGAKEGLVVIRHAVKSKPAERAWITA